MNSFKQFFIGLCAFLLLFSTGCKKPPGPGGKAKVKGKIFVRDFDKYAINKLSEYYGSGESVFICYGDNSRVGNSVKSSTDGSFAFLYLNKGHYLVFANSRDTCIHLNGSNKTLPVIMEFDITGMNETVDLGDLTINK